MATAGDHAVPNTVIAEQWLRAFPTDLAEADTHRNEMAFWMYSSGSTGRPKGIVHLRHDMAYTRSRVRAQRAEAQSRATSASRCRKIFFAYGFRQLHHLSVLGRRRDAAAAGPAKAGGDFRGDRAVSPRRVFGLPTLYTSLDQGRRCGGNGFLRRCAWRCPPPRCCRPSVFNAWKTLTGLEIVEGLGSTEVLHIYLSNRPDKKKARRRGPSRARLRDRAQGQGRPRGRRQRGRHHVGARRFQSTPLYWNRPTSQRRPSARADGSTPATALCATATAFISSAAAPTISIKISGQWVYPLEVELCLAEHPTVRECAVFAAELPDRRMTLKAVVVMERAARSMQADATRMLQDFRQGQAAALQISARGKIHRRVAEDRHRQDRPPGGVEDVDSLARFSSHRLPLAVRVGQCVWLPAICAAENDTRRLDDGSRIGLALAATPRKTDEVRLYSRQPRPAIEPRARSP